jgi:serine/threonine-protein kinase
MSPPPQDLVGQVLSGTYRFEKLLGTGGMGAVYMASHLRLPKRFAIKVLHAQIANSPDVFARFRREAEVTSAMSHLNIVQVMDFAQLPDGTHCMVMEFLEGEDLSSRLHRQGAMSYAGVTSIMRSVGSALLAAHARGIVHRDLKPQNIFLCRHEEGGPIIEVPKLVDFGISKIRHARAGTVQTIKDELLGTPNYMSPEQARGDNDSVDHRTDQFALAAIAYECLTGELAFPGDTLLAAIYQVTQVQPAGLPTLTDYAPEQAVAAIRRALQKDREARYPSLSEFLEAFTGLSFSGTLKSLPVPLSGPDTLGVPDTLRPRPLASTKRTPEGATVKRKPDLLTWGP